MKRRLATRAFIVSGAGALLFLAAATAQAGWMFVLAAGVLGLVAGSVLIRQNLGAFEIERTVPIRARVGDEVRVGLLVRNPSRRALALARIEDRFPAFEPTAVLSERLAPGGSAHIESVRTALRRGDFVAGPISIRSGAPFGFLTTRRTIEVASKMTVVPRWAEIRSFPILEPSSFPTDVLHERARTGAGEEYLGVRDYRPGDPQRTVHWRSSARAGHLVVREFEEEVATRVSLVIGGIDYGVAPDSSFEMLASAAASIALYALVTGHPVELARTRPDGEVDRLVDADRFGALDWLAKAEPIDVSLLPAVTSVAGRSGKRGTVVLLAPTAGVAGERLPDAVKAVQSSGSRAIVIAAKSSTWTDGRSETASENDVLRSLGGGRAPLRVLSRGEDLLKCLA